MLGNDSDAESDPLTAIKVSDPLHGSLILNSDGSFIYHPDADYNGSDSFTYKANDGTSNSNTATVEITINPVNDAPVCSDVSLAASINTQGQTDPDCTDADNDPLTFSIVTQPVNGSASIVSEKLTYMPDTDFEGSDSFTYKANDGTEDSNTATVAVLVREGCEDDPTLVGCWQMEEGSGSVLVDGSSFGNNATLFGSPTWVAGKTGNYALDLNGSTDYGLAPDDASLDITDAITLAAWIRPEKYDTQDLVKKAVKDSVDGYELTLATTKPDDSTQKVFFRINDATNGDTYRINAATVYPIDGTWMHAAGTFDGTTMRLYINGVEEASMDASSQTIALNDLAVSIGGQTDLTRFFQGQIDDVRIYSRALSAAEIQNLFGGTVNQLPVAVDDGYSTDEDTELVVGAPGVLGNDTDADLDPLSAVKVSDPVHGSLTLNSDGSFSYMPEGDYNGDDSFTYKANDGTGDSNTATVEITVNAVNDPPILGPIGLKSVDELVELSFSATAVDIDLPAQTLSFSLSGQPTGASINSSTGAFSWTPTEEQGPGDYPFDVCVSDGLVSDCETITVTVNEVNVAPSLDPIGNKSVDELVELSFSATAVDIGSAGATLSFSLSGQPTGAAITSGGAFSWTPTEEQGPGVYPFDVCVSDGLLSDCETISVTVNEVGGNQLPIAVDDSYSTDEDTELVVGAPGVLGNDTDADLDPLSAVKVSDPVHGSLTLNSDGSFSYMPEGDYNGDDSFTYKANDGTGDSNTATVEITVNAVNDPPILGPIGLKSVDELVELSFSATAVDIDLPAQTLSFSLSGQPTGASINSSTGAFSWTPTEEQGPGDYPFDVCVSDGLVSDCETITVTVNEVNVAPSLDPIGNKSVDELVELSFSATAVGCDLPRKPLSFSLSGQPTGAAITSGGAFSWTPTEEQGPGVYPFDVCVSDGLLSDCETISVTVNEVGGNQLPVAVDDGYSTDEDTELVVGAPGVLGNDTDADLDPLSAVKVSDPVHGSLTLNSDGSFSYMPEGDYNGVDSFTYKANDGTGDSNTATVEITINAVNDAPICSAVNLVTDKNVMGQADPNCTDVDSAELTYSIVTPPVTAVPRMHGGKLTYTPDQQLHWPGQFHLQGQ